MPNKPTKNLSSYVVFSITFSVAILSFISVVFPALFVSIFDEYSYNLEPFELGYQAITLIIINTVVFAQPAKPNARALARLTKKIWNVLRDMISVPPGRPGRS